MNDRTRVIASATAVFATTVLASARTSQLSDTFTNWLVHPAIDYKSTPPRDVVAQLNQDIQDGKVQLKFDGPSGYLRSVIEKLNVPIESQIAVFVPDSVQRTRIHLENPRTLFFNDSVAVGWVRGGFVELAAQDPQQGVMFYALDQTPTGQPQFQRRDDCLSCHYSYATAGVPGMLVRSSGQFEVDQTVPLEKRWGGWYVTGRHGSIRHLGNADLDRLLDTPAPSNTLNWSSFDGKFDTTGYLSTHSDIVALMVFEHQMHMMNLLSRIGWEARVAAYQKRNGTLAPSIAENPSDTPVPLGAAAKEVVDYLLFVDEAPIGDTIIGSAGFAETFAAQGPYDSKGRSLRQFDLQRRLMRYPCSYMIYAPLFNELPDAARDAIYRRMWQILSGSEKDPKYVRLPFKDRQAIVEILRETKKGLPQYFRSIAQ
jgi:hypothetical protein